MRDNIFRWLHLSDFHVGKDEHGENCLFDYILSNVRKKVDLGKPPSAIFITGDIANTGSKKEYETFLDGFFWPLNEIVHTTPCADRIFLLPGNHDVSRSQVRALNTFDIMTRTPNFLDPTLDAQSERHIILPKFRAFMDMDPTGFNKLHWIATPEGALKMKFQFGSKQIGVLGLNSAWLSDENERHNISFGKAILERGLKELSESDIVFVLSHHPVDWFLDDEVGMIKAILAKNTAIYLHGHLHKTQAETELIAGGKYLSIQAGASFQARDSEQWINRIVWAEANLDVQTVNISPLLWSRDNQEWVPDTGAFFSQFYVPSTQSWELALPKISEEIMPTVSGSDTPDGLQLTIPIGWEVVSKDMLSSFAEQLSKDEVIKFFDGQIPSWKEALSSEIPRRQIVSKLVENVKISLANPVNSIFFIKGSGGEGKSTVIKQAIVDLVKGGAVKQVLWNKDAEFEVPELENLNPDLGPWIIASDDAENLGRELFRFIKRASEKQITGICLILSFRDTDWTAMSCERRPWQSHAQIVEFPMRGLTEEDAERIVKAWEKYNQEGLGHLFGFSHEDAVKTLLDEARKESSKEGAFLGAMLRTRIGEDIKKHVKSLLTSFERRKAPGGTLRDAFSYIVVPHAENCLFLSKGPLAKALGCKRGELKEKVLGPLGEETMLASSGEFVLTRHRAIAETAIEILSKDFYVDTDEIIIKLLESALELSNSSFVPNIAKWRYISSHYFHREKRELGIRLAQATYDTDRSNAHFIVNLAKLLRQYAQPTLSVELFRNASTDVVRDRTFYFEWGISEGVDDSRCNGICLASVSLADDSQQTWPTVEDATMAFAGMGTTFARLYELYDDKAFIEACSATSQLGSSIKHDKRGAEYFREAEDLAHQAMVEDVPLDEAFLRFRNGVLAAWERKELDLSVWIPDVSKLEYSKLRKLLHL